MSSLCVDISVGYSAHLGNAEPAASDLAKALVLPLVCPSAGFGRRTFTLKEHARSAACEGQIILGVDLH